MNISTFDGIQGVFKVIYYAVKWKFSDIGFYP